MRNRPKPYTLVSRTNHYRVRGAAHYQVLILRRRTDGALVERLERVA